MTKDLEKDEREAMETALDTGPHWRSGGCEEEFRAGWLAAKAFSEARLGDVKAELSIAREALEELDAFRYKDRRAGVVEGALARLRLARLQAKAQGDDEPIAEQMEKWDP